jgi:uncharacterized protein DUF6894
MRYFFHIVDKYGLSPDGVGCDHADQDAAVLHARRIAAELTKAGEFLRFSVVFVARIAVPGASSNRDQSVAGPVAKTWTRAGGTRTSQFPALAVYRESLMCRRERCL